MQRMLTLTLSSHTATPERTESMSTSIAPRWKRLAVVRREPELCFELETSERRAITFPFYTKVWVAEWWFSGDGGQWSTAGEACSFV